MGNKGPPPILQLFSTLLECGPINILESIELAKPVVAQGRLEFVQKMLKEKKLFCSEELGDIVKPLYISLSLSIYIAAGCSAKVMQSFVELGQYDKVIEYAKQSYYR